MAAVRGVPQHQPEVCSRAAAAGGMTVRHHAESGYRPIRAAAGLACDELPIGDERWTVARQPASCRRRDPAEIEVIACGGRRAADWLRRRPGNWARLSVCSMAPCGDGPQRMKWVFRLMYDGWVGGELDV